MRDSRSRARGPMTASVALLLGDVDQARVEAAADMVADPGRVMGAKAGAGDEIEAVRREPRDA